MMDDLAIIAGDTITPAKNKTEVIVESGTTSDIIDVIMLADIDSEKYTADFAPFLVGDCDYESCESLYRFVQDNITYIEDPAGKQWIKLPSQLWESKTGDCKSYSLFIGSVLKNMGIPFVYRFVAFAPGDVSHVYVVAFAEDGTEIILDAVPPMHFDEEHPGVKKMINKKPAKSSTKAISGVGSISTSQGTGIVLMMLLGLTAYTIKNIL